MPIKESGKNIFQIQKEFNQFRNEVTTIAGVTAVNTFKQSFVRQGWISNRAVEPWAKRKPVKNKKDTGRKILVMSGRLKRSLRIVFKNMQLVTVGTDVPYAKAHNEGLTINKTVNVREHKRRNFRNDIYTLNGKRSKRRGKYSNIDVSTVKAHTMRMNTKFTKRQFAGNSKFLDDRLNMIFVARLKKIFS